MNPEILNNIYNHLKSNGLTDSDFNSWQTNFNSNSQVRTNIHNYLKQNKLTDSDYNQWESNIYGGAPKQQPIISSFQDPNRLSKDRGYRNNNPLNLKDKRTKEFRVFNTLEEGYQAAEKDLSYKLSGKSPQLNKTLREQGKSWGDATIKDLIYTWAPPSDNSKESLNTYLKVVQQELGVDPNTTHPSQVDVKALTIAMSKMESGHSYDAMLKANRANKNEGIPSPANKLSPVTADLEKEAVELANKKVEETYGKLTNLEKGSRTIQRKGIFGIVSDMFDGNGYGALTATKQEIEAAKIEVLKKGKYGSFNTPEELATVVNPNYKKNMDDANRAAEKQKASLEADFNTNGLVEQGDVFGGFGYKKNSKGEKIVNVNPNRLFDFNLSNENYLKVDDVLKLKEHPAISKDPKKFNYREQKELNQYLRDIQSDLTKDQQIARQANTGIYNDYLTYAGGRADILKSELEKQYGKLDSKKMSQETATKLQQDPRFAEYKQVSDNYLKAYETLKTKSSEYKLAELNDNLTKEFNRKQDAKYKDFTKLGTIEKSIQRTAEFVRDAGKALADSPGDLATLVGTGVDAVADTDLGTTSTISKAYNAGKISTTADSRGVLVKATKLKDKDIYAIYDDDGKITEFTDGGYYTVSDDPNSKVFKQLLEEEKSSENSGKPSININTGGLLHSIREPMIDMVPLILGGGVARIGLQSTAALLPKVSRLGNSLNKLSESSKFLSFAGSFAGFSGKMTDSAIKEGGLVNPGDIFIASTAKTALEAVIEMYNPIEGKLFTDKLFSSLSKQEVKQLSKIITEEGVFKALPIIGRDFRKTLLSNGLSEGFEEVIAAVAEPEFVNRVLNATIDTQYDETASVKDIAESFLVGALSGVAMGGILEGGPSAISQLRNPDQVFKESIRAGLQNKDLFDKITNQNREEELKDVEDETQIEAINKKYDKINSVIGKAHEYSSKVFQEHPDSGHIPASYMQTLYATTAFSKAINESKQYTLEPDIEANAERIAIADKKLKQLDVFVANSLDVFASIEDINAIDNIMSKKELSDNYGELYTELKSIASTESKSKHSDQQVLDNVTAKIKSKLVELKNKSDNKVDPELQKKVEAEKAAAAAKSKTEKQTQKAKEAEAKAIAKKKAGQPLSKDESKLVDPIFKLKLKNLEEELKTASPEQLEEIKSNPEYQFPEAANMISAFEKGETFKKENIDETDYLNTLLDPNDPTTLDKKYKGNEQQLATDNIKVQKFLADTIKGDPKKYAALSNILPALESNGITDMFALSNALSVIGVDINDVIHDRTEVKEVNKKTRKKQPVKKTDPVQPTPKDRNKVEGEAKQPNIPNLQLSIPGAISATVRLQGYDENNNPVGSPITVKKEDFYANRFGNVFTSQIPNARYVRFLDGTKEDIDKNVSLAVKPGDTVYYEYEEDTEFNNTSKRTDDNFEIQVIAYNITDENGYITIVSIDTPNAVRSIVARIPMVNTNQTPEQQKHLKDLRARFLKDKTFIPVKVSNTSSITDYRYGLFSEEKSTHREVTEADLLNPKATVGILSTPWNSDKGEQATVFVKGEALQLPYPAPIAQTGSVVLLIDNQIHVLHTKKIKDLPTKYKQLTKLLKQFASEANADVRNGIWKQLIGRGSTEGIVRYRTEKSNMDVERQGEVVNNRGIGPQLFYNPDTNTIVYEGKRYIVNEQNINDIIDDLAERRVHIEEALVETSKDYKKDIVEYLTTDLAELNTRTGTYQIAPTIYTEIGNVEVQHNTDIESKKADIERRRQEELDNSVGEGVTKNALKKANKPSKTKEQADSEIEKVKKENKELINKLEDPNTTEEEWDKLADELGEKFRGTSNTFWFDKKDGKIKFAYTSVGKNGRINTQYSNAEPDSVGEYEVGDLLQVSNGSTNLPAKVTKVSSTGRVLEAKTDDGTVVIRNGFVLDANQVQANRVINAKYDAELSALKQPKKTTPKKLTKQEEQAALFDFLPSVAKETKEVVNPKPEETSETIIAKRISPEADGEEIFLKVSSKQLDSDAKGLDWFKQRLGEIAISIDDDIINSLYDMFKVGGSTIYGAFMNASVILSSNSNEKVTRHEAMHVVFNLFLNPKQQEQILNELYNTYGKEMGITKDQFETELKEWRTNKDNTTKFKLDSDVDFTLKAIDILQSDKAKQVFNKGRKNNWSLDKILSELQVPKEQQELIKQIESDLIQKQAAIYDEPLQLALELASNYSHTVEVNTAKEKTVIDVVDVIEGDPFSGEKKVYSDSETPTKYYHNLTVPGGTNYTEQEIATPLITPSIKGHAQFSTDNGIGWFRSDDKNIENTVNKKVSKLQDIPVNTITFTSPEEYGAEKVVYNKIDGNWINESNVNVNEFALDMYNNSIELNTGISSKTRRILEVQSDLFQKGRDKNVLEKDLAQLAKQKERDSLYNATADHSILPKYLKGQTLIEYNETVDYANELLKKYESEYNIPQDIIDALDKKSDMFRELAMAQIVIDINNIIKKDTKNNFLQLLNKDNNWVTFFVKSIIQDSAKKGYEKVLFPSGNTASKVEGHGTLEEFKREKEERIEYLESRIKYQNENVTDIIERNKNIDNFNSEINQLKQELERVETEGFGALKPIYNFYENTVTNILKKQGYNAKLVTDEYGNTWNEITIDKARDTQKILLKTNEESYYKSQGIITRLEEKLSDLFEDYKDQLSLFTEANRTKYPGITKFFDKLYKFMRSNYLIARSYFTEAVTIQQLFDQLEYDTLGRDFLGRRKKSIKELLGRNIESVTGKNPFFKLGWSSALSNRFASFINKELLDVYLNDKYGQQLGKQPNLYDVQEVLGEDIGKLLKDFTNNLDNVVSLWKEIRTLSKVSYDSNILDDIINQFKTNKDFQKIVYSNLNSIRGLRVEESYDQTDKDDNVELQEDEIIEGWILKEISVDPVQKISRKLKEFLSSIPVMNGTRLSNYRDTGQTEYYDTSKIHSKLLEKLSNSVDLSDMLEKLNQIKDEYDWVKLLYMNILGKEEYVKRRNAGDLNIYFDDIVPNEIIDTKTKEVITGKTINNSDVIFDMWLSIGALRNIDFRFIKEDFLNGAKKVALVASNKQDINLELEKKITNFFSNNYYDSKGKLIKFKPEWIYDILSTINSPDIPQILKVINKLGISIDREAITNILKNDKPKLINALNLMYTNLTEGKSLNQKNNNKIYSYTYKNVAGKYSSTNGYPVRILTQIISKNDFNLEKRSILTLGGELKYNHNNNNNITKTYDKFLKNPKEWVENRKFLKSSDNTSIPVLLHSDLQFYEDLIEDVNELDIIYYEGNKRANNFVGTEFGNMNYSEIAASNFNMFASSGADIYRYFNLYAFSDASNKAAMRLKTFSTELGKNSSVINRFTNIALAEAKRIQYINSLDKPTIYQDYDRNGKSFQTLTFLNNSPIFKELLEGNVDLLDTMIVTDSKGVSKFNKNIQESLELEINDHLGKELNKYVQKARDNGQLIVKDGQIQRTSNSKFSSELSNDSLKSYFYNQYYYTAATNLMFNGDPAFYSNKINKNTGVPVGVYVELSKRAKQGDSPATLGVFKRPNFKAIILKDIYKPSKENVLSAIDKLYSSALATKIKSKFTSTSSNNLTDAGTYITLDRKEEQMKAYNLWIEEIHAPLFERLRTNTTVAEDYNYIFDVVKPFYYGIVKQSDGKVAHAAPVQVKNAEVTLIPQLAYIKKDTVGELIMPDMSIEEITDFSEYRSPELAKLLYLMQKHKIDAAMFESAVKAARFNYIDFDNLNSSSIDLNSFELPNEYWGEQQKNPIKQEDYKVLLGSQVRKLIYGDIDPDFKFEYNGSEYSENTFRELFDQTIVLDLQQELEKTKKTFDNEKKVYDTLERKTLETNPTGQTIEAFEIQTDGKPLQPLETNGSILEKFLNSFFKKASKVKAAGAVLANTPNLGYSDKLEIVTNEDGSIKHVEVAIPIHTEAFKLLADKDGLIDINDPRIPEKMRDGFFYRIPTEDKYSMYPIKIKYLIPMGSVIMLPNEATEISGLDFDVDKMYGFLYKTKVKFKQDILQTTADNLTKAGYKLSDSEVEDMMNYLLTTDDDISDLTNEMKIINESYKEISEGKGVQIFDKIEIVESSLDTSEGRANLRLDMMLAVAKTKGFARSFFDGGSKERLEDLVKLYEQKNYGFEKSIANPNLQEEITARNLVAKTLIGIFANSNAFHNLIQGRHDLTLRQPLELLINGNKFVLNRFSEVINEGGGRISKELSILLFASTEDAKNPVLEPLNINQTTAGLITTLIRLGLPLEDTIAYVNEESFKRVITYMQANNIKDLSVLFKKPSEELLTELGITPEQSSEYYTIGKISKDLLSVERAIKVDTGNVGPTFSEVLTSLNKAEQVITVSKDPRKDFKIDGIESVLPEIQSYYDNNNDLIYTINRKGNITQINGFMEVLVEEVNMLSKYFNYFSKNFKDIRDIVLDSTKEYYLRPDQVQLINLEIYNFHIQKSIQSLQDSEIQDIYSLYQLFPSEFLNDELLNEPDYQFLKSIFAINYDGIPRLEADITAYSKEDINNLKDLFESYIAESSDTKNGLKLAIYAIINGLKYGKGSFSSLVPPSFYRSTVGGMIRNIINGNSLDQSVPNEEVAELIIYNNYTKLVLEAKETDIEQITPGKYKLKSEANVPFFWVKLANESVLYKNFASEADGLYYSPIKIGLSNGKIKDYIQDSREADRVKQEIQELKDKLEAEEESNSASILNDDEFYSDLEANQARYDNTYIPEEPPIESNSEVEKRFRELEVDQSIARIKNTQTVEELLQLFETVPDNKKEFYKQYFTERRKELEGSEILPKEVAPVIKKTNKSAVDIFFDGADAAVADAEIKKTENQRQKKIEEINSILDVNKLNEMESKVPADKLEFYKPHFDRRRQELKTPNIPNQEAPKVYADRVVTVNGREILVKVSGGMYYTNGKAVPETDNVTISLARVKIDIIDGVLRTANHEGKNYYILSNGKVVSADAETLGSETIKDRFKKDIIIAKASKYKC